MYAIIETGGKQYKVESGDVLFIEKLDAAEDATIVFDKVVALCDKELVVGTPYVTGATVEATILKNGKGKKITVLTYKPKKGKQRKLGHRQPYTKVQINSVGPQAAKKTTRKPKAKAETVESEAETAVETKPVEAKAETKVAEPKPKAKAKVKESAES